MNIHVFFFLNLCLNKIFFCLFLKTTRYIPLTEEIKSKIDSSQKVAKKLERFQRKQNNQSSENLFETESNQSDSEDDEHNESTFSSYNSNETSFSSKNLDLTDKCLEIKIENDILDKFKHLELNPICSCNCHKPTLTDSSTQTSKLLSVVTAAIDGEVSSTSDEANNNMVSYKNEKIDLETNGDLYEMVNGAEDFMSSKYTNGNRFGNGHLKDGYLNNYIKEELELKNKKKPSKCDFSTQTLSTGDIVITKVYFNDGVSC